MTIRHRISACLAAVALIACAAPCQPPLLEYFFDGPIGDGMTTNTGSFMPGPQPLVGHEEDCPSPNLTTALRGNGVAGSEVTTGFTPATLGSGSWTVGFCTDSSMNPGIFQYVFGDGTTSWRIFYQGAAGVGNSIMRGGNGWTEVGITGGAGDGGWVHTAWVYDSSTGVCTAYLDGVAVNTVPQPGFTGWGSSTGNLAFGRYTGSATVMQSNVCMEDAKLYDRALTASEIATWAAGCLPTPTYQLNTPACSFDVDGATNGPFSPIQVTKCTGAAATANVSGVPGPWDAAITVGTTTVPDLGIIPNWRVNINLADPSLTFLFNVAFNPANPLPTAAIPITVPPGELDAQLVVLDPPSPSGLALSAAVCLVGDPNSFQASVPGPSADDTPLGPVDITAPPLNCPAVNYYGTMYTSIFVNPNGRVSFTAGDSDFTPSVAEFLADPPSLGVWSDFSPNINGSVTIGKDCNGDLVVRWSEVPYFAQGATPPFNSFDIRYEGATNFWHIENLTSVVPDPTTSPEMMIVGACPGNAPPGPGTDPGPQDFTQGAAAILNASDAIYEFGSAGTYGMSGGVLGGAGGISPVNGITFVPNGLVPVGYDWVSN